MKTGDLFRYIPIHDIHDIGVGSIGLIVGIPQRIEGFYHVLIGNKEYILPFHHIQEIK